MGVRGDMEPRGSLHRTGNGASPVVYNAQVYNAPLLPFEKQLIETIGATEEEYRYLVAEALKKSRVRPAGYEHVPDIRATGAEGVMAQFLISLAVGVTLSVITYLLTPKPRQPKGQERRDLGDINNAGRYNPTFGFDSQAELATYNDPIPIIFGKATYTSDGKHETGGLLVSPRLVWSRMFSQGTQQAVKMAFVVGEQGTKNYGIDPPALSGVFIGNNPLDSIYKDTFAFYWRAFSRYNGDLIAAGSRLLKDDLQYGTRGGLATGDQSTRDDILNCPTDVDNDTGFSAVYNPSNNTQFGCYAPIANGSGYRVNWRIIPMIDPGAGAGDKQPEHSDELAWERIKIAGWFTKDDDVGDDNRGPGYRDPRGVDHDHEYYTQGTGRNYSRRMGILNFDPASGSRITASNDEVVKIIEDVKIGDKCEFFIMPSSQKLDKEVYDGSNSGVKIDDINSEINAQRAAADDALQLGELFQIGKCTWQVIHRSLDSEKEIWTDTNNKQQVVTLKCIDNNEGNDARLGIVSLGVLYPESDVYPALGGSGKYGDGWINDTNDPIIKNAPGGNFFPLLRHSKAILKNTRKCRSTEIGIRSKVFQSLNGLCNFQTLLTPEKLHELENRAISVTSGTISSDISRSSFFCLKYRDAEANWSSETEGWKTLKSAGWDGTFAVTGARPVDQYNWVRTRHTEDHRYEYQIRPITGAGLKDKGKDDVVYRLASGSKYHSLSTGDNSIRKIEFVGKKLTLAEVKENKEFFSEGAGSADRTITTVKGKPTEVTIKDYVTEQDGATRETTRITSAEWVRFWGGTGNGGEGTNQVTGYGRGGAFSWEIFGDPTGGDNANIAVGGTKTVTKEFSTSQAGSNQAVKPVRLILTAKKVTKPNEHSDKPGWWTTHGITHNWVILSAKQVEAPGNGIGIASNIPGVKNYNYDWDVDNEFYVQVSCSGGNKFATGAQNGTLTYAGMVVKVTGVATIDVTRGRLNGMTDQIFDTDSTNVHALNMGDNKVYELVLKSSGMSDNWKTNISDSRKLHLKLHGSVINISPNWTGRFRGWKLNRIEVIKDNDTSDTWNEGETIDLYREGSDLTDSAFWNPDQGKFGWQLEITNTDETRTTTRENTGLRIFEAQSQLSDISFYANLVQKSNGSNPEHTVTYVNEFVVNEEVPKYSDITTAALSFKASRNFNSLDQVRVWLKDGIKVTNLHPEDSSDIQSSNLFTDLVYYLLTDRRGGVGETLGQTDSDLDKLIDKAQLGETAKFLRANKLFFNGALSQPVNIRSWIAEKAPNLLCDFILSDGRFTLKPALPVTSGGEIDTGAVTIKQIFTSGNILEDSFKLDYIDAEERRLFKAIIRYRAEKENQLPGETTVTVRWGEGDGQVPIETFDLTDLCTSRDHAVLVGKYFVALRRRVTHTCSFSTTPYGLDLAPGDYIRVVTESSPYSSVRTGTIAADGTITLATSIEDGSYDIIYYATSNDPGDSVEETTINVTNGKAQDWSIAAIFSLVETVSSENVYRVEQLTLNQENTVEIVASEFPCDNNFSSLIAQDITGSGFQIF